MRRFLQHFSDLEKVLFVFPSLSQCSSTVVQATDALSLIAILCCKLCNRTLLPRSFLILFLLVYQPAVAEQ